jgi:CRP-like cAMP-binding protein
MWATGCIMYALLCGELPFFEEDDQAMFRRISQGRMHAPSEEISAKGLDLLSKLLDVDRVKRLTAAEALEHKWITGAVSSKAALTSQKPINRSRMQRFADQKLGEDALTVRELDAGDLLIKQGARAKEVFLIKSGRCEVVVNRPDGSEAKVAERGEGEFVGEMGADVGAEAKKDIADEGDFGYNPNAKREAGERAEENGALIKNATFDARADAIKTSPTAWVSGASASAEKLLRRGATNDDTSDEQTNASSPGRRGADVRALEDVTVAVMNAAQMRWLLDHDYGADSELTSAVANRRKELERATRTVTFSDNAPDVREYKPTPLVTASRQW